MLPNHLKCIYVSSNVYHFLLAKHSKFFFLAQNKSVLMTMLTKALLKKKTQIVFTCSLRGEEKSIHIKLYSLRHLHCLGGYRWLRGHLHQTTLARSVIQENTHLNVRCFYDFMQTLLFCWTGTIMMLLPSSYSDARIQLLRNYLL